MNDIDLICSELEFMHIDDEDISIVEHFPSIIKFERFYTVDINFENHIPRCIWLLETMPNLYNLTIEPHFYVWMEMFCYKIFAKILYPSI